VRPRLDHRLIDVGSSEQPSGESEVPGTGAAVVAASVEPLMMERGDGTESGQVRRAREEPLGVVGMQANLFPVVI